MFNMINFNYFLNIQEDTAMKQDKNSSIDTPLKNRLDWVTTIIPFVTILALCSLFMIFPDASSQVLGSVRFFLGDQFGSYYLLLGLGALICSLYMAFSRYGRIKLGNLEKPQYSSFQWGSMMFTAGLAADILFYSLCEWMLYAGEPHITDMGAMQDWASTYPLFHWGPIPWSFYIILAVSFGFMLHVRKRNKQKYSEACRPLLGKRVDGIFGKLIDLTAVFALLAGTATTFSLATPLLSMALSRVLGIPENNFLTIGILVIICVVYTMAVYFGMQGIAKLAASCVYLFFGLLASRQASPLWGTWYRTSWAWPPGPMPCAPPPFPRTGLSFTGPTGWYGVLPLHFSSAPSVREGPSDRLCWEVISSGSQVPLHPLSSWAITDWDCRCTENWT